MSNSFGKHFCITTFGESHGMATGCVIDGCPSNLPLSEEDIQIELDRRRPGQSPITTQRNETDRCQIISGVYQGRTIGSPICILIPNTDARSADYVSTQQVLRPNHGDFTWWKKYHVPPLPGGGRLSARETAARVAAGFVAKKAVHSQYPSVDVVAWVHRIQDIAIANSLPLYTRAQVEMAITRCPDPTTHSLMLERILHTAEKGDTVGGALRCVLTHIPAGALGTPVFEKLESRLADAMMGIPSVKYFISGDGLQSSYAYGSENNDLFYPQIEGNPDSIATHTNHSGGIQGGISNGMPVVFEVGFKPVSTIFTEQQSVDLKGVSKSLHIKKGRHDPCVLPRAVPIVEAMAWLVIADELTRAYTNRI